MDKLENVLTEVFEGHSLINGVLSDARKRGEEAYRKVLVRPVQIRNERRYQFEYHQERKTTHRNLAPREAADEACTLLAERFRQAQFYTAEADIHVAAKGDGSAAILRKPATKTGTGTAETGHNRKKNYLIPEDQPCDFLIRLGVMTATGRVIAGKYDKFKQINRFLEMVADVVDHLPADRPLRIIDFGSGKSYLTFALYHYLRVQKQREARIVGLDLKKDVVAQCNVIARDLRYDDLTFVVGDIEGYDAWDQVDMVVTLHACDTATDDALVKAVAWGAHVILSVPCCQHELFRKINNDAMRPLLKHGILKERLSALITDAMRAELLELSGYSVQMLEFIDMEHTPKNLLIRGVLTGDKPRKDRLREEYRSFRDFWHVRPYMEEALKKETINSDLNDEL